MSQSYHDVACTVCGCVCDDIGVTVDGGRVVELTRACPLAEPWFHAQGQHHPPAASIDGHAVPFDSALDHAAGLLRRSRSPLIYGLSRSSTDGQRAAVALADRLGATIDTTASLGHAPSVMALQDVGESTCTLGEIKNRADLVIYWGSNPVESHPRHFERYSLEPAGEFVPNGRAGRTLVVADVSRTSSTDRADLFLPIEPGRDFDVLWTLRGLVRGVEPRSDAVVGASLPLLRNLAERMKSCQCGVVFFGLGLSRSGLGHRNVAALLALVTELNHHTRFYARRMRVSGDVAGADSVLAWQTGYPFSVNLAREYPRFNPGEFTAAAMLERREVDACLLVGSYGVRRFSPAAVDYLKTIPTVVLDAPHFASLTPPTVRFTTAVPGVHLRGTAYRMDEVPIPLKAWLPTSYASDADVLTRLIQRLGQLA